MSTESSVYTYRAFDRGGTAQEGEIEGESKASVAAQLRLRGLTVVDVNVKKQAPTVEDLLGRWKKVKARDLTVFSRQLATMVSSGLSLLRALYILED